MNTSINIWVVIIILFIHWIADFVFQTDWMAKNKGKSNKALFAHVRMYIFVWFIVLFLISVYENHIGHHSPEYIGWTPNILWFLPITFVCHFITDYITSRINAKLNPKRETMVLQFPTDARRTEVVTFPNGESYHNLFISIGFDQLLHFAQLLLTYQLLTN